MPKERPILFSGPMVRAILDGNKTQTRRLVKQLDPEQGAVTTNLAGRPMGVCWSYGGPVINCPYGNVGDRLWVREAFAKTSVCQAPGQTWVVYREYDNRTDYGGPWKPSIHMPRYASRIILEITSIRVERLHAITDADAYAEGTVEWAASVVRNGNKFSSIRTAWKALWESINGVENFSSNPWVWVIDFKKV